MLDGVRGWRRTTLAMMGLGKQSSLEGHDAGTMVWLSVALVALRLEASGGPT